jgi:uncharacterized membrane protein YfcA
LDLSLNQALKARSLNLSLSLFDLLVIFGITSLGAAVQGAVGYGMALIVSPILLLIDARLIPGPLTLAAAVLVSLVIHRDRQALDIFGLKWAILGLAVGTGLGAYLLYRFSSAHSATAFSGLILLAVLMSVAGLRLPPRKSILVSAGFLSGVMGILTTTSGPPIALVYQDAPGQKLRATISGFFVVGIVFACASLISIGRLGIQELLLALALLPGILLGFGLSSYLAPWVDRGYTRPAVLTIAFLSSITALIKQIG